MTWFRRDEPTRPDADLGGSRLLEDLGDVQQWRLRITPDQRDLVDEISGILFRADPIGLNFESNTDEYDQEAEAIVLLLPRATTPEDVQALTYEFFVQWLDAQLAGPASRYVSIAQDIWHAWQRHPASGPPHPRRSPPQLC